jgi:uncharacterized membrane protein
MKTLLAAAAFSLLTTVALSFSDKAKTSIVGKVSPADATEMVWAVGPNDSLKMVVNQGQFYFDVKPGTYKVVIDAREPYKDVLLDNLLVKADETLDLGEIQLKQ